MQLSNREIEILRREYNSNWKFQIKLGVVGVLLGIPTLFIPVSRAGSMIEVNGFLTSFLSMFSFVGFIWLVMYFLNVHNLKKDLKFREKVAGKVKVKHVEYLSDKLAQSMVDQKDTFLHFEKNPYQIKKFMFNKKKTLII